MSARPAPMLLLEFPYEAEPRWRLIAESAEDETRMRLWLRRSDALDAGEYWIDRLRERLERIEEAA